MKTSKLLLTAVLVMIGLTTMSAATVVSIDGINYSIDADNQTAVVVSGNYTGDLHIVHHVTYKSHDLLVTGINSGALDNKAITSLVVDDSVSIGALPTGCSQLTHITWPSTEEVLSGKCDCPALTQIDIPEGVTTIPTGTFRLATSLKSITLPSTIENLGIIGSEALDEIVISPESDICIVDGWLMNYDQTVIMGGLYKNVMSDSLVFPENVEEIQCFFLDMTINDLSLPSSLKQMPSFVNCYIDTSVRWPENIPAIDKQYFSGYLKELIIPASVTAIKEYAFGKEYAYGYDNTPRLRLDNLIFEDGIDSLTVGCLFSDLNDCGGIDTFTKLKYIYWGRTFKFQPEHTYVDGGSITWTIYDYNIFGDQSPKVYKIGKYIDCDNSQLHKYIECDKLDTLAIHQPVPPKWHPGIRGDGFITTTLLVPRGSLQRYQNDEWWGQFWEILEINCDAFPMGDVNHDCIIDVEDVNRVINMILKLDDSNSISDMNGDGIIDVEDVNAMINIILKL